MKLMVVSGKKLLFVMALDAEFGPRLRELITPLMTGVGPVEAAVMLGAELARLKSENNLPDLVVSLGSAGSRSLQQAEVYQVASVSYRDMDASALGFAKGATPFLDLPATVPIDLRIEGIKHATLSTGAAIVSGQNYDAIDADMVDMESFAVLRACQLFGIPFLGLRGISDGAADLEHIGDWTRYLEIIDEKWPGPWGSSGNRFSKVLCLSEDEMRVDRANGQGQAPALAIHSHSALAG